MGKNRCGEVSPRRSGNVVFPECGPQNVSFSPN